LLRRHGRWLGYLTASVVVGATGGAWALVSLGPDVDRLPVQNVIEAVQTPLTAEHPELIAPALNLYRSDLSRSTDTADTLLVRLGVQDLAAAQFLRRDPLVRQHLLGRPGRNITVQTADARLLDSLTARWSADDSGQFRRLVVKRQGAAFTSRLESAALESSTRLASGSIESSLFAATDAAGLPDTVATQLAEIFSGDIDFRRALRKGDRFNVVAYSDDLWDCFEDGMKTYAPASRSYWSLRYQAVCCPSAISGTQALIPHFSLLHLLTTRPTRSRSLTNAAPQTLPRATLP